MVDRPFGQTIQVRNLTKNFGGEDVLSGIDLTFEAGSFTALLGPSGCGKSTALRLISGLEPVSSGQVLIGDTDVTQTAPSARDIAMVFQSYALFPHLNVAENITFGLRVRKTNRSEREDKLRHVADLLGLEKLLDRKPSELSGGQQQRVALGRAIVSGKSIFLMDEPLSNLDAKLRAEMREEIRALQQKLGVTMIYVTHDQVEAVTMADQVVLMNQGRVEQCATPRDLYETPATLFAAKFIGTPPMVTFSTRVLAPDSTSNVTLGLRPEAVQIVSEGPITAMIDHIEYLGADAMLACATANGETVLCRASGSTRMTKGDPVSLSFAPADLHAFAADSGQRLQHIPPEIEAALSFQKPGLQ